MNEGRGTICSIQSGVEKGTYVHVYSSEGGGKGANKTAVIGKWDTAKVLG